MIIGPVAAWFARPVPPPLMLFVKYMCAADLA